MYCAFLDVFPFISIYFHIPCVSMNIILVFLCISGSVLCNFTLVGIDSHLVTVMDAILRDVSEGQPLYYNSQTVPYHRYMVVDGEVYNGTNYTPVSY